MVLQEVSAKKEVLLQKIFISGKSRWDGIFLVQVIILHQEKPRRAVIAVKLGGYSYAVGDHVPFDMCKNMFGIVNSFNP